MGNYSQDPNTVLQSALSKGYSRVRFQQGKPILDRELNLIADLASPERLAQQYIGDGVPAGSTAFQITSLDVAGNNFTILPGTCRVAGLEVTLATQTTYKGQPNTGSVGALPAGVSNVYLHVFNDEVVSSQDTDLQNSGDVGVETSVRLRNDWEVVVSSAAINDSTHFLLALINTTANSITDQRRTNLTLAVVRDEVVGARGTATTLSARLNAADQSFSTLLGEVAAARGTTPALTNRLSKTLGPDGSLLPGTVTIQVMASTLIFNAQVSVPAATNAGPTQQAVTLLTSDNPAFLLINVHFDGPRGTGPIFVPLAQTFSWEQRVILFKPIGSTTFNQHIYQILLTNPNNFAISVTCKVYQLAEV